MASMSLLVHVNENSCWKLSIYETGSGFVITVFVLYVSACCSSPDRMLLSLQKCTLRGIKDKRWNKWFLTQGKCRHSCIMALCGKKKKKTERKCYRKAFPNPQNKSTSGGVMWVSMFADSTAPHAYVSHSSMNLEAFIYITHCFVLFLVSFV